MEIMVRDYSIDKIADMIEDEAMLRLDEDHCCPGGITSKIHAVYMELVYALKERMMTNGK
jgi:hypothetical protein